MKFFNNLARGIATLMRGSDIVARGMASGTDTLARGIGTLARGAEVEAEGVADAFTAAVTSAGVVY